MDLTIEQLKVHVTDEKDISLRLDAYFNNRLELLNINELINSLFLLNPETLLFLLKPYLYHKKMRQLCPILNIPLSSK